MGFGTTFTADIYLSREDLTNIYQVNDEIEDCKNTIAKVRERLFMYVANGVDGVNTKDSEGDELHANDVLYDEVSNLLEELIEANDRLHDLYLLKEDYDEETKKFRTAEFG